MCIFDLYSEEELRGYLRKTLVPHYVRRHMIRLEGSYKGRTLEYAKGRTLEYAMSLVKRPFSDVPLTSPRVCLAPFVVGLLIPFDQLPLYINVPLELLQRVIQLRFKQGR